MLTFNQVSQALRKNVHTDTQTLVGIAAVSVVGAYGYRRMMVSGYRPSKSPDLLTVERYR